MRRSGLVAGVLGVAVCGCSFSIDPTVAAPEPPEVPVWLAVLVTLR